MTLQRHLPDSRLDDTVGRDQARIGNGETLASDNDKNPFPAHDTWPDGVQVFCLGSAHGDDQIGWLVGDALRHEYPSATPRIHFLNHVWQLAGNLDQCQRAILIDACFPVSSPVEGMETDLSAGTILRMGWPDPRLQLLRSHSTHRGSVAEALELAGTLDWLPEEVVVFGITAGHFRSFSEPSPEVLAAIPRAVQSVEAELARY